MSQTASTTGQNYKLLPLSSVIRVQLLRDYKETIYTVFVFTITALLIALGLRLVLALFVMDGTIMRSLVFLTAPFVAPFTGSFHDQYEMVQVSTAAAFTAYYAAYWLVAVSSRPFRHSMSI